MINTEPIRVLVIDKDSTAIDMLIQSLDSEEFEVFEANSGIEGIEAIRGRRPQVIIMDLLLPDMDGWEVCRTIRSISQAPILVHSAVRKPGIVAQALNEGADGFLQKPMTRDMLVAHLNRLARRAAN